MVMGSPLGSNKSKDLMNFLSSLQNPTHANSQPLPQTDEYLSTSIKRLLKTPSTTTHAFRIRSERVHRAQKLLLEAIYLAYTDIPESFKADRTYRRSLPPEDQRELEGGFSENILFAAQALSKGFRIRGIEGFTGELVEPAKELHATLEALRFVFRCRAFVSTSPPHDDLFPVLRDFDRAWTVFEQKICFCYFSVAYQGAPGGADETDMFQVLMSETLLLSLRNTLLTPDQIHTFDPQAIIAIPRLTIVAGLLHMPDCVNMVDEERAFRYFRGRAGELRGVRDQLRGLGEESVRELEGLLCRGWKGCGESGEGKGKEVVVCEGVGDVETPTASTPPPPPPKTENLRQDSGIDITPDPSPSSFSPSPSSLPPTTTHTLHFPTRTASLTPTPPLKPLYLQIASIADDLSSGPRAKEFVGVLHRVFSMHAEEEEEKKKEGCKVGRRGRS
ncbi:hypothetical protein HDV00_011756 [Rhizophlyctis rosea]|nr:hypothetical protein HDV00_011756 [Rhizophlyctis rosea]